MFRKTILGGASAALFLPAIAVSQEASGTITGAYNADDAVWTVSAGDEDLPDSGWAEREDGLIVTLVGRPGPEGPGRDGTLVVRFTMEGRPRELSVAEPSVTIVTEGGGERFVAGPDTIDLSVTALQRNGEEVAIAGDLVATLTPGGSGGLSIDNQNAVLIDGNFQASLTRLDGEAG
jgi:hypothetical protein